MATARSQTLIEQSDQLRLDVRHKTRRFEMAALKWILEGGTPQSYADHIQSSKARCYNGAMKLAGILYFRCPEREGLTRAPTSLNDLQKNAEFWLRKYHLTEHLLHILDPKDLPTT